MRLSFSWKPISSPGRSEKFPPPLMRFLRSNVSSRSRGRTRATPLFLRRKKSITTTTSSAIETQEPSSPKVTCIGQVRVRRSKSSSKNPNNKKPTNKCSGNTTNHCCYCFKKPSFCKLKCWKPSLCKWVSLFNCRSVKVRTDSSKFDSNRIEHDDEIAGIDERERRYSVSIETTTTTTTTTTTPPKNALLLTRCRSAPYRSSSLACQFWGSPLRTEEEAQKTEEEEEEENRELGIVRRDSTSESRGDQQDSSNNNNKDMGICAEVENEDFKELNKNKKEIEVEVEKVNIDDKKMPLMMLKRCKSEPARSDTEKYDPESSEFWRHRRLGNTESSTPTFTCN